jgi:hypothetical protein
MKKIDCVFCEKNGEKAKEHIWPKWLQKEIIGSTKGNFSGTHISMSSVRVLSHRNQSGESLVFGNVCKYCNNGWMSNLEIDFKQCFEKIKLNYNSIKQLSKTERNKIALWGFKTAMMINSGSNYRKIIPLSHFNHLYKHRQLPKNLKVDLTYLNSQDRLKWEQSNFTFAIKKQTEYKSHDPYDLTKNSYVISMQIEKLGIKILFYNGCKEKKYKIKESKGNKAIRISPYIKNGKFDILKTYNDISEFHNDTVLIQ